MEKRSKDKVFHQAELPDRLLKELPTPSAQFRRRAWLEFQRALDPLGPPKPLPLRRR